MSGQKVRGLGIVGESRAMRIMGVPKNQNVTYGGFLTGRLLVNFLPYGWRHGACGIGALTGRRYSGNGGGVATQRPGESDARICSRLYTCSLAAKVGKGGE